MVLYALLYCLVDGLFEQVLYRSCSCVPILSLQDSCFWSSSCNIYIGVGFGLAVFSS